MNKSNYRCIRRSKPPWTMSYQSESRQNRAELIRIMPNYQRTTPNHNRPVWISKTSSITPIHKQYFENTPRHSKTRKCSQIGRNHSERRGTTSTSKSYAKSPLPTQHHRTTPNHAEPRRTCPNHTELCWTKEAARNQAESTPNPLKITETLPNQKH